MSVLQGAAESSTLTSTIVEEEQRNKCFLLSSFLENVSKSRVPPPQCRNVIISSNWARFNCLHTFTHCFIFVMM